MAVKKIKTLTRQRTICLEKVWKYMDSRRVNI